jgi:hypothetical protein
MFNLDQVKEKIKNMDIVDYYFLLGISIGCIILFIGVCMTFNEIETEPDVIQIESTTPVVPYTIPPNQTIDININPDPTTIPTSQSNLPFHQEIHITGSNNTIYINGTKLP